METLGFSSTPLSLYKLKKNMTVHEEILLMKISFSPFMVKLGRFFKA
ncbi:hypothetical protein NEOC65_000006 [Neochlamydia sp. AcF65]|nr:hypothetical protein [Neochlamydia sp. AcF65]